MTEEAAGLRLEESKQERETRKASEKHAKYSVGKRSAGTSEG